MLFYDTLFAQLLPGDLQSTIDGGPVTVVEHPLSQSQTGTFAINNMNIGQSLASPAHVSIPTTTLPSSPTLYPTPPTRALDLVGRKLSSNRAAATLAEQLTEEAAMDVNSNPWGNDDLIDINADQDDWGMYKLLVSDCA